MSHEPLVRDVIERFNDPQRRDIRTIITEDVVLYIQEETPNGGRYEGIDAYMGAMGEWLEAFDEFTVELVSMEEHGDTVLAELRQFATVRGSSLAIEQTFYYVIEIEGERFRRHDIYAERELAAEAFARS